MKKYLFLSLLTILLACEGAKSEKKEEVHSNGPSKPEHHSVSISKVFDAHGGYDQWSKMKQLSYDMPNGQHHLIELQNRYTRVESEAQTIGYDGEQVWVMPAESNASRARMTYNLYFYFYAFPFVIGDPGIFYEDVDSKEIMGKVYDGVKVTYGNGVGDSPKDIYIVYFDPDTHKMEWLMYTATFGAAEASDRFNLINYGEWQEVNGVILPKSLQWYQYSNGEVGNPRNELIFENVVLEEDAPSMDNFTMPEGAKVAPDPNAAG